MVLNDSHITEGGVIIIKSQSHRTQEQNREAALEGYFWYGEELIPIYPTTLTQEERLEILDSHPIFTGKCPQCGYEFDPTLRLIHWDCPECSRCG